MTLQELQNKAKDFLPAFLVRDLIAGVIFKSISTISYIAVGILSVLSLLLFISDKLFGLNENLASRATVIYGLFFICLSVVLIFLALKSFFNSYAFLDIMPKVYNEDYKKIENLSFESASFFLMNVNKDPVLNLLNVGSQIILTRLGIPVSDIYGFIQNRSKKIRTIDLNFSSLIDFIGLDKIATLIYEQDKEFQNFLASRAINKEEFIGAVKWAGEFLIAKRHYDRFWSRDNLRKIPGIGKAWAYGETPTLWRYAIKAEEMSIFSEHQSVERSRSDEIDLLERTLLRGKGSNALLVSETDNESLSVVMALAGRILEGQVAPEIEDREVYILDHNRLVSETKNKALFEKTLTSVLTESIKAGDIILVIRDLAGFMASAQALGSSVSGLLDWYLKSSDIHIIVTANNSTFHSTLEKDPMIMSQFEKILISGVGAESALNYLKSEALRIEVREKVFFTFQAIKSAVENAERFFPNSTIEDKSLDLLSEVAVSVKNQGRQIVEKRDILKIIEEKLGVPISSSALDPSNRENEVLLNLEKILSKRVIGQEAGIKAISLAMRRAHSGIGNPNRPMGSFLFLGPTGVGKTETTKALADTFFGGESAIIRLDMSEFNTFDALERLIGNFAAGKAGVLSSKLRDRPYGVLLLDEFEKTSKEVLDLFLQILDEGFFSDMSGKKVNARNLIIIATSNAGSQMIWKIVKEQGVEALNKDKIILEIINQGIFKPELINRFDGVVVFHPLNEEHLKQIANLMLQKLNKRLETKGISVVIDENLIMALIQKGMDPTFGARPMARAIQDRVESIIAERLLRGEIKAGDKIVFTSSDLEKIRD